ncbi:MAG: hypothetical protein ACREEM_37390, partial [Blastocatellia bacterium]
ACRVEFHDCCYKAAASDFPLATSAISTCANSKERETPRRKAVASGESRGVCSNERETPRRKAVASCRNVGNDKVGNLSHQFSLFQGVVRDDMNDS